MCIRMNVKTKVATLTDIVLYDKKEIQLLKFTDI